MRLSGSHPMLIKCKMYCKYYLNLHLACYVCKNYGTTINRGVKIAMKNFLLRATILLGIVSSVFAADLDTARIDELTGLKGKMNEKEGVYKVTFPRKKAKAQLTNWLAL